MRSYDWSACVASPDTNRAHTTVGFPVVQLNTVQKQFVATRKVPLEVIEQSQDRTFAAAVREAKADVQIGGCVFPDLAGFSAAKTDSRNWLSISLAQPTRGIESAKTIYGGCWNSHACTTLHKIART